MKLFILTLVIAGGSLCSQTIDACRQRFDRFLNFNGSLSGRVKFDPQKISVIGPDGKLVFAAYREELEFLRNYFTNSNVREQANFIRKKGGSRLDIAGTDSLRKKTRTKQQGKSRVRALPLDGVRIALDPGHFGTDMQDAKAERKYLYFHAGKTDTIRLFESVLNFQTAWVLKNLLEGDGAQVLITRAERNLTSFGCTYRDWRARHRKRVLDSLVRKGDLPAGKAARYLKKNEHDFFWDFFRDFELAHRADIMNEYSPDLVVIVHYNVDEANDPWKKFSPKNFTMAFIAGAFTAKDLNKPLNRAHFLRLLFTDQLDQSRTAGEMLVKKFNTNLGIPAATSADARYLRESCLGAGCPGVFCRNLALCRTINSPLIYGESLYQDNEREARELMKTDLSLYGIKTNQRIADVAKSYAEAIVEYFRKQ